MTIRKYRILMLLENESVPEDCRVQLEAESLVAAGFDVCVICPTGESSKKYEVLDSIHVYRYPKPYEFGGVIGYAWEYGYSLFCMSLLSLWVLFRRGFDCIHVHTPPDLTAVIAVFYKLFGKSFVFDHHDLSPELYMARKGDDRQSFLFKLLLRIERFACSNADRLVASNETQRRVQSERGGASEDRCVVVRNGPNDMFLKAVGRREDVGERGKLVLGYVGVVGIQDGVDYLVRAVAELVHGRGRSNFVAVIVGDGDALQEIVSQAEYLQVSSYFDFRGMVPFADVPAYINAFDICLTPDPSNAYNDSCTTIKTMEYMALGKPTVCFRTTENEITAGPTALYADNNDVSKFADAIEQLMDAPELRSQMGMAARQRIEQGLTWYHQQNHLVGLYDSLRQIKFRGKSEQLGLKPRSEASQEGNKDLESAEARA